MPSHRIPSLDPGTRRWSQSLSEEIARHPGSRDEVIGLVLRQLRDRFSLDAALSYGIASEGGTLQVEFSQGLGLRSDARKPLRRYLQVQPQKRWGFFDPARPEPSQRNRVRTMREDLALQVEVAPNFDEANRELGIHRLDQIRVLVCEGPALLAWVGGFRQETVAQEHRAAFASIVPSLQKRLVLEQALARSRLRSSALDVVLEALSCAAFILRENGGIVLANAAGRALVDVEAAKVRTRLRASVAAPGADPGIELTRFPVPGEPACLLALIRPSSGQDSALRARLLGSRWGLTPRQREVLNHLAWGTSNKAIAAHLRCAESTVEQHVAAIMRRAEVASRAEIVARFWTSPVDP